MSSKSGNKDSKKVMGAFVIKERGEGQKALWIRVGSAFRNADDSINVVLNATPLDGKVQLRELDDKTPDDGE